MPNDNPLSQSEEVHIHSDIHIYAIIIYIKEMSITQIPYLTLIFNFMRCRASGTSISVTEIFLL